MNLPLAFQLGALIQDAYAGFKAGLSDYKGQQYHGYTVIQTIYANNLATDLSVKFDPLVDIVPMGFVAYNTATPSAVVIVMRGTEGIWQWIQDAKILPIPFSAIPGTGLTEDGFTDMYMSLRIAPDPNSPRLVDALEGLLGDGDINLTICGHSLGSALVTLLALEVAVKTRFKQPTLYTFASPRVGDPHFASYFNVAVPNCYRIANRMDIVTHVATPPLYIHVGDETELNPGSNIADSLLCMHDMATYLFMLSSGAIALSPSCMKPVAAPAPPQAGGLIAEVAVVIEKVV